MKTLKPGDLVWLKHGGTRMAPTEWWAQVQVEDVKHTEHGQEVSLLGRTRRWYLANEEGVFFSPRVQVEEPADDLQHVPFEARPGVLVVEAEGLR